MYEYPKKVTEVTPPREPIDRDTFIVDLAPKLARVIDLNANVVPLFTEDEAA